MFWKQMTVMSLREAAAAYKPLLDHEKAALSHENAFIWNDKI